MSPSKIFEGGGSISGSPNGDLSINAINVFMSGGQVVFANPLENLEVDGDITCAGNTYSFPTSYPSDSIGSVVNFNVRPNIISLPNNVASAIYITFPAGNMGVWACDITYTISQPSSDGYSFQTDYTYNSDFYEWTSPTIRDTALSARFGTDARVFNPTLIWIKTQALFSATVIAIYQSTGGNNATITANAIQINMVRLA